MKKEDAGYIHSGLGYAGFFLWEDIMRENGSGIFFRSMSAKDRTKVKVSRCLDVPDVPAYEAYISRWHGFLLAVQEILETPEGKEKAKEINIAVLHTFYLTPYEEDREFYPQFYERTAQMETWLKEL